MHTRLPWLDTALVRHWARSMVSASVIAGMLSAGCGRSHKTITGPPPSPAITTASPAGGTYSAVQSVTLTSDRVATIYYSVNGVDPSVGGSNTRSGASPVTGISIPNGTTVLKFFSVSSEGATESVRSETYVVDALAPTVSFSSQPPAQFALLSTATIDWQSDEAGSFVVELGGSGVPGSGTHLSSGSVVAGVTMSQVIHGWQLSLFATTPLCIHVTDASGHVGTALLNLGMKPAATIPIGAGMWEIAVAPSGGRVYMAKDDGAVAVIDTDPGSPTYNTVVSTVSVGTAAYGIAITPDGSRAYVTVAGGGVSVISTATNSLLGTLPAGNYAGGIAITPDGSRAYYTSAGEVRVLDTNPASPSYHSILSFIPVWGLLSSTVAIAPDGSRAVVNWQGTATHGIDVIDVNPSSATYNTVVASPVPIVQSIGGDVVTAADNIHAYATDGVYFLSKIHLGTGAVVLNESTVGGAQSGIDLTPDGAHLLNATGTILRVVDPGTLREEGRIDPGAECGLHLVITPDGTRAYVERWSVPTSVICVPLK